MKTFRHLFVSQKNYIRDGKGVCQYCGLERVMFSFTPDNEYAKEIGLGCRECLKLRLRLAMKGATFNEYEIGGVCVHMTVDQAAAWNRGDMEIDWTGAKLFVPGRVGARSYVRDGETVDVQGYPTTDAYPLVLVTRADDTPKHLAEIGNQMEGCEAVLIRKNV